MAKKHGIDLDDPSPAAAAAAAAAQLVAAAAAAGHHGFPSPNVHDSPLMHSLQFGANS
jgi:ABC-type sugar transport system substrate-binding protein